MSAVAEPPTQTAPSTEKPAGAPVPNKWCVVLGTEADPFGIVGPFNTVDEAHDHAAKHDAENPSILTSVEELIDPANC